MITSEGVSWMTDSIPYLNSNIPCSMPRKINTYRINDRDMWGGGLSHALSPRAAVSSWEDEIIGVVGNECVRGTKRVIKEQTPVLGVLFPPAT